MQRIGSAFLFLVFTLITTLSAQEKLEVYTPLKYNEAGHAFVDERDYLSAEKEFAKIHPNDTLYNQVLLNRVICYRLGGSIEQSLALAEEGFEVNKDYLPEFYINKASCLDSLGKLDEAIDVIVEAEKRFPYNYDLKVTRAELYQSKKDYKAAIELFQECITAEPTRYYHHLQLGSLLYDAKALSQSMLTLVAAMALNPESENNLNILNSLDELVTSNSKLAEPLFDPAILDEQFEDVDDLISNYIALADKYKVPGKINFSVIKQIHLLLTQIDDDQDGFFSKTYVPIFKPVIEQDKFEDLTNLICYMSKSEKHQKIFAKKQDDIVAMSVQLRDGFKKVAQVKNLPKEMAGKELNFLHNDNDRLFVITNYDEQKDVLTGPSLFINEQGSIARQGSYNSNGQYTGEWNWYFPNGKVKRNSFFENDKLTGKTIFYNELGNIQAINHFKDNKLNGKVEYYKLIGTKYEEVDYVDDVENGTTKGFYSGGQVAYEIPMKDGQNDGPVSYYYEDGSKKTIGTFKDDKLDKQLLSYYRNGTLSYEENYIDGVLNGTYKSNYHNGQLYEEGEYKDGNRIGHWTQFNFDGSISSEEEYDLKGNKNGVIKNYSPSGILKSESFYKNGIFTSLKNYNADGVVISEYKKKKKVLKFVMTYLHGGKHTTGQYLDNLRSGTWNYYDAYGNLITTENYSKGEIVGTVKRHYRSGQVYSTTEYEDGMKNGLSITYFPNGQMSNQGYYKDNELHGRFVQYYINGSLSSDEYYTQGMLDGKNSYHNPDGSVYLKSHENLGFKMGSSRYDSAGQMLSEFSAENGEGTDIYYFSTNKEKMGSIPYKGGDRNGKNLRYHINGNTRVEAHYETNKLNGVFKRYYIDGQIKDEYNYEHGQLQGLRKAYYKDGTLSYEANYENNQEHGVFNSYFDNGQLSTSIAFNYGDQDGAIKYYTMDGDLSSVLYYEDSFVTGYSYEGADGKLVSAIPLPNGTGQVEAYFPNGQKSVSYTFKKGSREGEMIAYYPDGTLRFKDNYADNYLNGKQVYYYSNGNIKSEKTLIYGNDEGTFKYYYEDGTIEREESYLGDERHGPTNYYDKDGQLILTHNYIGDVIYEIK